MATTLNDINNRVNDRRRDSGSSSVDMTADGFRAVIGALEIWDLIHDWVWQEEESTINYNEGIDTYTTPTAFKADIDLRPRKSKGVEFEKVSPNKFDSSISSTRYAVLTKGQAQRLRINYSGNKGTIHPASDHDADGTWTASSDASNVSTDIYESFDLSGSVKFDVSGTSAVMTNDGFSSVDLSQYQDRSSVYFNLFPTSVTNLSSITIKVGSASGAYWSQTVTTDYLSDSFTVDEWNRIKFDDIWSSKTGSPDITAIDYVELTLTFGVSTTATAFRIENFFVSENVPLTFEWYSHYMAKDASASNAKITVFNDSAATTDPALFSGDWDYALEPFVDTVLDTVFFITGEISDRAQVIQKAREITAELRQRHPSRRRFPIRQMVPEVNFNQGQGVESRHYRKYKHG